MTEPILYDAIGAGYSERRQPDPTIFEALRSALGEARRIVNVGAGAGSYEPPEITVAAVEPSSVMAAQRPAHLVPAVLSPAESLPFVDSAFDGALAILTIHHWRDLPRGLRELRSFLMSFWDRPELVLDPEARAATSGFARLSDEVQERICETLGADLRSGRWDDRYGELRTLSEFDSGLRLVLARG